MGKLFYILMFAAITCAHAQTNLPELSQLKDEVDQSALEEEIHNDSITFQTLSKAIQRHTKSESACSSKKATRKSGETKLILAVEIASRTPYTLSNNPETVGATNYKMLDINHHPGAIYMTYNGRNTATFDNIENVLNNSNLAFENKVTQIKSGQAIFIGNTVYPTPGPLLPYSFKDDPLAQKIMRYSAPLDLLSKVIANEAQDTKNLGKYDSMVVDKVSKFVNLHYSTRAEKIKFLSFMMDHLYTEYNAAHNPLSNNKKNNPKGYPVPKGAVGITQLFYAVATNNSFIGGVCNDISAAVGRIAKEVFPGEDIFTIEEGGFNGTAHFGVLISDGKTITAVAGYGQTTYEKSNGLALFPDGDKSMQYRIQRIGNNGELADIFVGKTAYGTFIEQNADPNSHYNLKTTRDFSSAVLSFEKALSEKRSIKTAVGTAQLNDGSKVVALFASYDTEGRLVHNHLSVANGNQAIFNGALIRFHVADGFEIKKILYRNPVVKIEGEIGMKGEVEAGTFVGKTPEEVKTVIGKNNFTIPIFSADVAINAGVGLHYHDPNKPVGVDLTAYESFQGGSSDYSGMIQAGAKEFLKRIRLFPNHTQVKLDASAKLTGTTQLKEETEYTGTAIGQDLTNKLGFSYTAINGTEVSAFVGYTQKFKGTGRGTKYNYMVNNPEGTNMDISVKSKYVETGFEGKGMGTKDQSYRFKTAVTFPTGMKKKPAPRVPSAVQLDATQK